MFGRRNKKGAAEDAAGEAERVVDSVDTEADEEAEAERERVRLEPGPRPEGPWDSTEVRDPAEGRVDLGGLFVPGVDGMELRVEVAGDAIVAATVVLNDSAVQLQAFAAPKREGIWGEVREEIAAGITQQGGIIDEVEGPLGWELRAQVPVQLPAGQLAPPAPECPQGQRPGGPGEPEQQPAQALPFLAAVPGPDQPPAPQAQLPGQHGRECGGKQHGGRPGIRTPTRSCIFMGLEHTQPCTAQTEQHCQSRRSTQHQARHAGHQSQPGAEPAVGRARNGVEHQCSTTQLCQVSGDFMRQLGQAQAGNQRQQAAIGHGACVIGGLGFATKGKCHGLCTWAARQVVHGVPGCHQGQGQQHRKGNTCCEFGGHPVRCDLQGCSTQPVGEQTLGFRGQAQ